MALACQEARGRIKADPARARQIDFHPGMKVGKILVGARRSIQGHKIRFQLNEVAGNKTGGEAERAVSVLGVNGREYSFTGDGRNRVVRVYRVGRQAVYLSVEGPHLTPDAVDVQFFLESLRVP